MIGFPPRSVPRGTIKGERYALLLYRILRPVCNAQRSEFASACLVGCAGENVFSLVNLETLKACSDDRRLELRLQQSTGYSPSP